MTRARKTADERARAKKTQVRLKDAIAGLRVIARRDRLGFLALARLIHEVERVPA